MNARDPIPNVLEQLDGVKQTGNAQWQARCPAHDDRHASLSVSRGDDGRALIYCHAGCAMSDILGAIGLTESDLFADSTGGVGLQSMQAKKRTAPPKRPTLYATPEDAFAVIARQVGAQLVQAWSYPGDVLRVGRFNLPDTDPKTGKPKKTFRPIHRLDGGWAIGDPPDPLPLYRSDELPPDGPAFVLEGEQCVDVAWSVGLPAVASAHGAKSANKSDWTILAGREVIVMPDNDDPGRAYAEQVAGILTGLPDPATVRIVALPDLPEHGDLADWTGPDGPMGCKTADDIKAAVLALADGAEVWTPNVHAASGSGDVPGGPVLTCMADVEPREVPWLWPDRVPLGRITLVAGRPGAGKSYFTIDVAARVTTGRAWPDGTRGPSGSVILISAEDDPRDTIRPRLDAHGADVRKVHLLSAVRRADKHGHLAEVMFTLADVASLEAALVQCPDCRLIVVDPIGSFLGGRTDSNRDNEVRSVLAPAARLAEKYGPAVLVVAHTRKSSASNADDMVLGSRGFTGIARAVWHLSKDTEDTDRRLFLPGKNNLARAADGLAFRLAGMPLAVEWEPDPVAMDADDALAVENGGARAGKRGPAPVERDEAADWLEAALADGPRPSKELLREADDDGISKGTLKRAKAELGVRAKKGSWQSGWHWCLPSTPDEQSDRDETDQTCAPSEEPAPLRKNGAVTNKPLPGLQPEEDQGAQVPESRPRVAKLAPGKPGPLDLLDPQQRRAYDQTARAHDGPESERYAAAWRAAVEGGGAE